jgi:hypothetical protein
MDSEPAGRHCSQANGEGEETERSKEIPQLQELHHPEPDRDTNSHLGMSVLCVALALHLSRGQLDNTQPWNVR